MNISLKTQEHISKLKDTFVKTHFFGRMDVKEMTGLKSSRASEFLKMLLENNIIEPVKGHGKGKYRFL